MPETLGFKFALSERSSASNYNKHPAAGVRLAWTLILQTEYCTAPLRDTSTTHLGHCLCFCRGHPLDEKDCDIRKSKSLDFGEGLV
jgi:hypothetical protein